MPSTESLLNALAAAARDGVGAAAPHGFALVCRVKNGFREVKLEHKDEISMIGCDTYYHIYHRSMTAKGIVTKSDGGIVPNIASLDTGDFMQLPPVNNFALYDDIPMPVEDSPCSKRGQVSRKRTKDKNAAEDDAAKQAAAAEARRLYPRESHCGQQ